MGVEEPQVPKRTLQLRGSLHAEAVHIFSFAQVHSHLAHGGISLIRTLSRHPTTEPHHASHRHRRDFRAHGCSASLTRVRRAWRRAASTCGRAWQQAWRRAWRARQQAQQRLQRAWRCGQRQQSSCRAWCVVVVWSVCLLLGLARGVLLLPGEVGEGGDIPPFVSPHAGSSPVPEINKLSRNSGKLPLDHR